MTRRRAHRVLFVATLFATVAGSAGAQDVAAGSLKISHAWSRAVALGAPAAVGYLSISNRDVRADRLLGGSTTAAARLEIHQSTTAGGIMRMREVTGGVELPPGRTVNVEPGGYHLMFVKPNRAFRAGGHIPATLDFARAGKMHVEFAIRATPPAQVGPGMKMPMR